jgi:UDP-N-acetylmuramoyl-tripeptide--D-alanyl-D-alanine ligase
VEALPASGVAFLNCDDAYVSQFGRDFPGRVVYFGAGPCADPQILLKRAKTRPVCISGSAPANARLDLTLHLLGAHNASNAMAGLAVALEAGVDLDDAVAALARIDCGRQARAGDRDWRRNDSE